jgi:hypothetical protein
MSGVAAGDADMLAGWDRSTAVDELLMERGTAVPHVGIVIADRYVLRERLASGSTGDVWLSAIADRPVVVKLLAEDIEAPVRGTPLIELIEQGRADGRTYLVLEHAPGGSLRDVLRREGRLSQTEAMAVLVRVATVLHEAHLSGLVHRDVRPGHLLLGNPAPAATSRSRRPRTRPRPMRSACRSGSPPPAVPSCSPSTAARPRRS